MSEESPALDMSADLCLAGNRVDRAACYKWWPRTLPLNTAWMSVDNTTRLNLNIAMMFFEISSAFYNLNPLATSSPPGHALNPLATRLGPPGCTLGSLSTPSTLWCQAAFCPLQLGHMCFKRHKMGIKINILSILLRGSYRISPRGGGGRFFRNIKLW